MPQRAPGMVGTGWRRLALPVLLSAGSHLLLLALFAAVCGAGRGPGSGPHPTSAGVAPTSPARHWVSFATLGKPEQLDMPLEHQGRWIDADVEPVVVQPARLPPAPPSPATQPGPGPSASGSASALPGPAGAGGPGSEGVATGLLLTGPTARSVVYLIDRSVSMGPSGALDRARAEVAASLRRLPADTRFQIAAYNRGFLPILGASGELPVASGEEVGRAAALLGDLTAEGGTDHAGAIRQALALRPDVLFVLTDGADLRPADVLALTRFNAGRTAIHAVELAAGEAEPGAALAQLAGANGGTFRRVRPSP